MGRYSGEVNRIISTLNSGAGRAAPAVMAEQADLSRAVGRAQSTVLAQPRLRGRYSDEFDRILAISKGEQSALGGGAFAGLGKGVLGAVKFAGNVIGTPSRFLASAGKELSDLARGELPSPKQLVTQTLDTSFYPSTVIPKSGVKWADTLIGLGADIALDPLTYISFGATAAAGRSGRIALAGKYAETAAAFGQKADPKKLDDIVRLGEWALDDAERTMVNLPKGLRYQWGGGGLIAQPGTTAGKISGAVAEAGGKNVARVRAAIGDIPGLAKVQGFVRPKTYGGTMNRLGRGANLDGIDILHEVSRYSAGVYGRSANNLTRQIIMGDNKATVDAINQSPFANSVYQVVDGTAQASGRAIDPAEQALADSIIAFRDNARATANAEIEAFNVKRGTTAYTIGEIEDYGIPRTLTDEAQGYVRDKNFGRRGYDTQISATIDVPTGEVVVGPSPLRARQLTPEVGSNGQYVPKEWLGETLVNPADFTVDNINRISREKLGFDWFDTNAATYMNDYVESLSRQVARIALVDRLFDYGTEVVDTLLPKLVPDPELDRAIQKSIGRLEKSQARSAKVVDDIEAGNARRTSAANDLRREAEGLRTDLLAARQLAATRNGEIRQAAEQVFTVLEARLQELDNIINSANVDEAAATSLLRSLHVRAFPDVDDAARPATAAGLARELKAGARERFRTASRDLRARGRAGEDVARKLGAEKGLQTRTLRQIDAQLAKISETRVAGRAAAGEATRTRGLVKEANKQFEKAIKEDPILQGARTTEQAYAKAAVGLNQQQLLTASVDDWNTQIRPLLDEIIESARQGGRITTDPKKAAPIDAIRDMGNKWHENANKMFNDLASARGFSDGQREAGLRVLRQLKAAEVDLVATEANIDYLNLIAKAMRDDPAQFGGVMVNQIKDGWVAIEGLGIQMPQNLKDILFAKMDELTTVDNVRQFTKMFDRYAQFFRVSAMFTPGFIVRNAMTAAFNNFVYGVTPQDVTDAIRFTRSLYKDGTRQALASLPDAVRAEYEMAYRAVLASGGGQTMDILTQPIAAGERQSKIVRKVLNSKGGKWWSDGNVATETAARMGMALRSVRRGNNMEQTAAVVRLFHFDYSDLSKLDEVAKVFVPFWTFATRNIPLQLMMQIARPSVYRAYESVQRNAGIDPESMVLPGYLQRKGPLAVPGLPGFIGIPDLPQLEMEEQIAMFADPKRLLSQLYPQYRLLPELAGGRKLGIDVPFSETPQQVRGVTDIPAYLGALLLGGATTTAEGPAFSEKAGYAATSLLPTLGQIQRLLPQLGGSERLGERQISSILSTLGVPVRQVPAAEQERELQRRQFALRDYLNDLRRRGFIVSEQ